MKFIRFLPLLLVLTPGAVTWGAADPHHPETAASAPAAKARTAVPSAEITRMENHTQAMQQMHEKMVAAKTPEERNALMAEHSKTMREGMTMMNSMAPAGSSDMKGDMRNKGGMAMHHQMMEKRMELMAATMQMMMDRLPTAPDR